MVSLYHIPVSKAFLSLKSIQMEGLTQKFTFKRLENQSLASCFISIGHVVQNIITVSNKSPWFASEAI